MDPVRAAAIAFVLLAPSARGEDAAIDARRVVREALAQQALGPVAPPALPVLMPGSPGEPRKQPGTEPRPAPAPPAREQGHPGTPPGAKPQSGDLHPADHDGPRGAMSHSAQHEAVDVAAREAHRIRADEANRAAAGAAMSGAVSDSAHGTWDCHDAASTMRSAGMDPGHGGGMHHGMLTEGASSGGGTMPGGHQ